MILRRRNALGAERPVDPARADPADLQAPDRLLGHQPSLRQGLHEPEHLEAAGPEPVRKLRAGEHAAVQTRQRDPLGPAARQAEGRQRSIARPQVGDHRSSHAIEAPVRRNALTRKPNCCSAVPMPGTLKERFRWSQAVGNVLSVRGVRCGPTCPSCPGGRRQCGGGAPRDHSGEPVQRPRKARSAVEGGRLCRACHIPPNPGRRLIAGSVPVEGRGHQFRRGVDQPEVCVSSGVSPRLVVLSFTLR